MHRNIRIYAAFQQLGVLLGDEAERGHLITLVKHSFIIEPFCWLRFVFWIVFEHWIFGPLSETDTQDILELVHLRCENQIFTQILNLVKLSCPGCQSRFGLLMILNNINQLLATHINFARHEHSLPAAICETLLTHKLVGLLQNDNGFPLVSRITLTTFLYFVA